MHDQVTHEELMRYLDGETSPEDRERVEGLLAGSTELRREVAVFQSMKEELQALKLTGPGRGASAWDGVSRQLARPVGWFFLLAGAIFWLLYGIYSYFTSPALLMEKLATGAIVIGVLLLFASVIWEQYRTWLTDPYRHIQR